jgi:hypothetical protein
VDVRQALVWLWYEARVWLGVDLRRTCLTCAALYTIDRGEIRFMTAKQFDLPRHCKSCRAVRRKQRSVIPLPRSRDWRAAEQR